MKEWQLISLRQAIDAHLNTLPVQSRLEGLSAWTDEPHPAFHTWCHETQRAIEWRPKPAGPRIGYLVEMLHKTGRPFFTFSEAEARQVSDSWLPHGTIIMFTETP